MSEKPILFSSAMVRAILAGTKTQTRRVIRPPPEEVRIQGGDWLARDGQILRSPYGQPGDRLWVRETWGAIDSLIDGFEREDATCIGYRADHSGLRHEGEPPIPLEVASINWDRVRWRPSIHMPRWASRLTLAVESVRVERLQDISEEDARAEGVEAEVIAECCGQPEETRDGPVCCGCPRPEESYREGFRSIWQAINGKRKAPSHIHRRRIHGKPTDRYDATHPERPTSYAWEANPWVWAISFSVAEVRS